MNKQSFTIKRITIIAIFASLAAVVSYVDMIISRLIFPLFPIKIGISNIIIIYAIYCFNFKEAFVIMIVKSILTGLILGSYTTFIIGFTGSIMSFFGMWGIYKIFKDKVSTIGVSLVGGILHIIGQLLITTIIYQMQDVIIYYGWILFGISILTGLIIGVVSKKIIKYGSIVKEKNESA